MRIVTLAELDPAEVDMRTILLVGSSQTRVVRRGDGERIVWTPRRYPDGRVPGAGRCPSSGRAGFSGR